MDPANRSQVVSLIATRLKQDAKVAERTYQALMEPRFGLAPDAKFDMEGFKAVLALRAEDRRAVGRQAAAPDEVIDLGYYERAMKLWSADRAFAPGLHNVARRDSPKLCKISV